jgi:hypothetical protein
VPDYLNLVYNPSFETLIRNDLNTIKTTKAVDDFFAEHAVFIDPSQFLD